VKITQLVATTMVREDDWTATEEVSKKKKKEHTSRK